MENGIVGRCLRREDSCVPLFKKVPEQAFFKRENNSLIRLGKFAQVGRAARATFRKI
ncbi:MAG: hypothetical protein HWQ23_30540 [Nostoc sp. JL33]|uniref:hypothetical protein n=1 Tax=Nostoc sp. JL33 TaxID=2815396 RepID=UPI0025E9CF2D|nr:hypothetical protein [Nostoc sp. JL33]MBN3874451.1 hypothetical protein [Nostoc sp. JL33]